MANNSVLGLKKAIDVTKLTNNPKTAVQSVISQPQPVTAPSMNDQIVSLGETLKKSRLADLDKVKTEKLSSLGAEKATIAPQYYDKGNQARALSNNQARGFSEWMAAKGLSRSGVAGDVASRNNFALQGNLGQLGRQEQSAYDDIARRTTDVNNGYVSDVAGANATVDAQTLQNTIDQMNRDKAFGFQEAGLTGDYNGKRTLEGQGFDFNKGISEAGLTGMYNGKRTMEGTLNDSNLKSIGLSNEYQSLINAGYPKLQAAQMAGILLDNQGKGLTNTYQALINAGYPAEQASKIAQMNAQTEGIKIDNKNAQNPVSGGGSSGSGSSKGSSAAPSPMKIPTTAMSYLDKKVYYEDTVDGKKVKKIDTSAAEWEIDKLYKAGTIDKQQAIFLAQNYGLLD